MPVSLLHVFADHVTLTHAADCVWLLLGWVVFFVCVAARARHARRSDPLSSKRTAREAGRTFQKTFAAKVSVVPCCSVRFGTAEREQAELAR